MLKRFMNKIQTFLVRQIDQIIEKRLQLAIQDLKDLGIRIIKEKIDVKDFQEWMEEYGEIVKYYDGHNNVKIEKILEHYLVCKCLGIKKGDVYIDIAACYSPFSKILSKRGVDGYEQDLIYKAGINEHKIGGDASLLPVPNNFADVLSLQCAFECFQSDSDIGFIKESWRVLKKGGVLGIVPLYVGKKYFVKAGPKANKKNIKIEKEVKWIWRVDKNLQASFSRHYSPTALKSRVIDYLTEGGMKVEILFFTNLDELMKIYNNQRIYCHFMLRAVKQ